MSLLLMLLLLSFNSIVDHLESVEITIYQTTVTKDFQFYSRSSTEIFYEIYIAPPATFNSIVDHRSHQLMFCPLSNLVLSIL